MSTRSRRIGKYELIEELGAGGMGEVWKAFDTELRRYVAIKQLHSDRQTDPDFVARFMREARLLASLRHPNIVQIHDFQFIQTPGARTATAYMMMDYVEGQTLAGYIRSTSGRGQFPSAVEIVQLFTSISLAIDYAHQRGMIHRDIKPANILLDKRFVSPGAAKSMGEPILTDFGIARTQSSVTITSRNTWLGTPLYISPEQAQGKHGDERSDLYSLGIVLYEMLTGVPPFRGENPLAIAVQHVSAMPLSPNVLNPAISPAVSAVVLRSIAKDPAVRFPNAAAMTISLAEALQVPVPTELSQAGPGKGGGERMSSVEVSPRDHVAGKGAYVEAERSGADIASGVGDIASGAGDIALLGGGMSTGTNLLQPTSLSRALTVPSADVLAPGSQPIAVRPSMAGATPEAPQVSLPGPVSVIGRRRWAIGLIGMLIVVLLGSGLGAFLLLSQRHGTMPVLVVGQVSFINSGQRKADGTAAVADEVRIALQNVPAPLAGMVYYAWLENKTDSEAQPVDWLLPISHNQVNYLYTGDAQHTNLLATSSRLLITEEDTRVPPTIPNPDPSKRLYYAALPQTASGNNGIVTFEIGVCPTSSTANACA